jgi:hypothetical protein
MRLRALDLETTRGLLETLQQSLRTISNRAAALAPEASSELGDELGYFATDTDRLVALVEVLQHQHDTSTL